MDKELEAFKSLIHGLETIKADDMDNTDENKNDNDDKHIIGNLIKDIVNNEKENQKIESETIEEQKNDTIEMQQQQQQQQQQEKNTTNGNKEDVIKENIKGELNEEAAVQNNKGNDKNQKSKNLSDQKSTVTPSSSSIQSNSNKNPKKIQLVTEPQIFKVEDGDDNIDANNDDTFNVNDKENDEDIKSLVKIIVESDGSTGNEADEKKEDMFHKIKEAINNNRIKIHNSKLDKLAKAKEEDLKKGLKFSKPAEKQMKNELSSSNDNIPGDIFNAEESFVYKCFYDQECTNFKGFSPDVASCNKTSRHCSNYCFVQKACFVDTDCSTSCGSWCLREDDMVFGRCVMTFDEGDFCMESWRVCGEGLSCNLNTYICEKQRIPITFTRIDSQESLLSIVIFLLVAIYLIKNSRSHNLISFFSGYNINDYCSNTAQDYDTLPEYQRTEVLNENEMEDLIEPPPDTNAPSNVEEAAALYGYIDENNNTVNCDYIPLLLQERPVPYDPYNEPTLPYDVPPSPLNEISNVDYIPVNENHDINVRIPSVSSLSDTENIDPPPDYDASIF
ncbi:hypothetical protein BCR36DRAFT_582789, partial [Piromyces finnis]